MSQVFLGLGSNLGNRLEYITKAIQLMEEHPEIQFVRQSSVYETEPFGYKEQPDFLNMVIEISTTLSPIDLLDYIHLVENQLGRKRTIRWGPRTIDIDILLYDGKMIKSEKLQVPHPYLTKRLFVLIPLAEIYNGIIPGESLPIDKIIDSLEQREGVVKEWETLV